MAPPRGRSRSANRKKQTSMEHLKGRAAAVRFAKGMVKAGIPASGKRQFNFCTPPFSPPFHHKQAAGLKAVGKLTP